MLFKIIVGGVKTVFQGLFSLIFVLFIDPFFPLDSLDINKQTLTRNKSDIILIHGHLNSTWSFYWMRKSLLRSKFNIHTPAFGSGTASIYKSAERINKYIESKKITNPIIIGTSIGGLIGLAYLNNCNKWDETKQLITIASPFKGTPAGMPLKHISKSAEEILPNNKILSEMTSHKNIQLDKITSFRAKFDETVPTSSSILEGAKNIQVDSYSHFNVQYLSQDIYEYINDLQTHS